MIAETLQGLSGSSDPILDRELMAHATGLAGLRGQDDMSGLFSKIFKMVGPILPVAGAALAPFTGGASLLAAGALTAVGNAVQKPPGAPGAPPPQALVQQPPPPPNATSPVYAPAAGGLDQKTTLLMLGAGALVLVLLISRK